MTSGKPIIVITMGDAAGVGPEIVVKALASGQIYDICRPLVIGERIAIEQSIKLLNKPLKLNLVKSVDDMQHSPGTIDLVDLHNLQYNEVIIGEVCAPCGRASMENIREAVSLVRDDRADALVTAPINKESINN